MKILFLTENYPPETNAAATRVHERAVYWVRWGHEVTVITCAPNFPIGNVFEGYRNSWYRTEIRDGVRVVRVKTFIAANEGVLLRMLDFLSFMVAGFVAGLFQKKPDVVVSTSPQFLAAVAGWALAKVRRRPFVFELGDLWPRSIVAVGAMTESPLIRLVERFELFLYRQAAAVVALTNAFRTDLVRRGIPPEKIAVVVNGVDLARYRPRPRSEELARKFGLEEKFVIGYVGTLGMAHGLMNVLEAAELSLADDRLRFLLVGAGAERQKLTEEAGRRQLHNVVFMPLQPKDAMPEVWSLCDVALVHLKNDPAFGEVIPSKIFEAMGMGRPILLVAPPGEASRIIESNTVGLAIPAGDPKALADAALTLMNDDPGRQRMTDCSRNAASLYSRQTQAERMIRVLDAVAAGRGSEAAAAPDGPLPPKRPRVIYLVTEDWYFWSHRLPMAKAALAAGFEVAVATRVAEHGERILSEGFTLHRLSWRRRGIGPTEILMSVWEIWQLYRRERPDIVHHVALKSVVLGGLAASLAGVPAKVSGITGLGFLFTSQAWRFRMIRWVVATTLSWLLDRPGNGIIVQNEDDLQTLLRLKVAEPNRFLIIRGSGIDTEEYRPLPDPPTPPVVVAFVGRMLEDKGVRSVVQAHQTVVSRGVGLELLLVGPSDTENPTAIPVSELEEWNRLPGVSWLGFQENIQVIWAKAHIAVLPSRREGLPRSLLEAAALGRPIVATDVPGCREIARPDDNAILVPVDDTVALADAFERLARDESLRRALGSAGRELVLKSDLSAKQVGAKTVQLYESLWKKTSFDDISAAGHSEPSAT